MITSETLLPLDHGAPDYEYENACRKLNFADMLPKMDNGFQENEYVAVVYQDAWYPGCVTQSKDKDKAKVKFI